MFALSVIQRISVSFSNLSCRSLIFSTPRITISLPHDGWTMRFRISLYSNGLVVAFLTVWWCLGNAAFLPERTTLKTHASVHSRERNTIVFLTKSSLSSSSSKASSALPSVPASVKRKKSGVKTNPKSSAKQQSPKITTKVHTHTNSKSNAVLALPTLQAQLDYARNGHCVMRNALDPIMLRSLRKTLYQHAQSHQLTAYRQKVEVASNDPQRARECHTIADCQRALRQLLGPHTPLPFLQCFHAWKTIPSLYSLIQELAKTAAILLDVPSVRLYQDSLFWKRPGDGATPWHVDARMAPFDTSHMVTLWIPLHDVPRDGTALQFVSKSHADFALPYWNPPHDTNNNKHNQQHNPWHDLHTRYTTPPVHYMPMTLGDYTGHSGWTLHCANGSRHERLAWAITYVDARAPIRDLSSSSSSNIMDPEDAWSYQEWVHQVPPHTPLFQHAHVPIVYP
jgi:ectoine hydroxylase-related dioxygenase (phytanoyl-CoA dioxygenase family)